MNIASIGSVATATAASNGIGALINAMSSTNDSSTAHNTRTVTAAAVVEPRRHIHPEDVFESRKVIHPTARFEARQVYKFDATVSVLGGSKAKSHALPLPAPATVARHIAAGKVQQFTHTSNKATLLDMFI